MPGWKDAESNESFSGMIWRRVPKTVFVGSDLFKIGVYDAVAHFNMDEKATIKVLEAIGIESWMSDQSWYYPSGLIASAQG